MSEELGKIEKPSAEEFEVGRKLFFVPLLFMPQEPPSDFLEMVNRYWDQVRAQLANLEAKLSQVNMIYHELIPLGGEDGAKAIEALNKGSYEIVKAWWDKGAELQPIEDSELLTEFMDWNRCLAIGLRSQQVFAKVYESYAEAQKRRNEHIAKQIDETLKNDQTGILLMREGHQVQFPSDMQVFYVAPPALDEIKRWLRARETETQSRSSEESTS